MRFEHMLLLISNIQTCSLFNSKCLSIVWYPNHGFELRLQLQLYNKSLYCRNIQPMWSKLQLQCCCGDLKTLTLRPQSQLRTNLNL